MYKSIGTRKTIAKALAQLIKFSVTTKIFFFTKGQFFLILCEDWESIKDNLGSSMGPQLRRTNKSNDGNESITGGHFEEILCGHDLTHRE